jgi:hypothetical protein
VVLSLVGLGQCIGIGDRFAFTEDAFACVAGQREPMAAALAARRASRDLNLSGRCADVSRLGI